MSIARHNSARASLRMAPAFCVGLLSAACSSSHADPPPVCDGVYSLESLEGNGAAVFGTVYGEARLRARVTCAGAPVARFPVSWTVITGGCDVQAEARPFGYDAGRAPLATSLDVATDDMGVATILLAHQQALSDATASNEPGVVRASIAGASVDYLVTTFPDRRAATQILEPAGAHMGSHLGSLAIGSTIPIVVEIRNDSGSMVGAPVPNVAIRVTADTPGALRCVGDAALTGADGRATCNLEALGPAGEQTFTLHVGWAAGLGDLFYPDMGVTVVAAGP